MSAAKTPPLPLRRPPGYRDPNLKLHHHPPPPPPIKRRRGCCRVCCCCLCISLIILLFLSISAALALYLWIQPRFPQFYLNSISFSNFNLTATPDGPALDAAAAIAVEIRNPNQNLGFVYERSQIELSAVSGDVSLGERRVAGFSQGSGDVTTVKLAVEVEREIVDGRSEEELREGFRSRNLAVSVEIRSGIRVRHRRWATAPVEVVVVCGGVRPRRAAERVKCRIKMFNWVVFIH